MWKNWVYLQIRREVSHRRAETADKGGKSSCQRGKIPEKIEGPVEDGRDGRLVLMWRRAVRSDVREGVAIQGTLQMEGVITDDLVLDDNSSIKAQISSCKKSASYEWRTYVKKNSLRHKSQSRRKSTLNIGWKDPCWSWSSNTLATGCEELTHWKRPWCWERLRREKGMTEDEMVGWHHWLDGRESEWTLGIGEGQRSLVCCSPWGLK